MATINYKELILDLNPQTNENKNETIAPKGTTTKSKPKVTYNVDSVSGVDFVITRKTAKTERQLIMLFSVEQYYIKDKVLNQNIILVPDVDIIEEFRNFTKDLEEPLELIDPNTGEESWLNTIHSGALFADALHGMITDPRTMSFIKKGIYIPTDICTRILNRYDYVRIGGEITPDEVSKVLSWFPNETKSLFIDGLISPGQMPTVEPALLHKMYDIIDWLEDGLDCNVIYYIYGLDGLRKFVKAYLESGTNEFSTGRRCDGVKNRDLVKILGENRWFNSKHPGTYTRMIDEEYHIMMDLDSLINYLFVSSVEQGMGGNLGNFVKTWQDTLLMEHRIFGKIEDKYPKHLLSYHQILSYKSEVLKDKIDKESWERAIDNLVKYEDEIDDFVFVAPKTKEDLVDEGRQQSNCVASYAKDITQRGTVIMFMRHKEEPDKSYITIEVTSYGRLNQVKTRFNNDPSDEDRAIVNKWYQKHFAE